MDHNNKVGVDFYAFCSYPPHFINDDKNKTEEKYNTVDDEEEPLTTSDWRANMLWGSWR